MARLRVKNKRWIDNEQWQTINWMCTRNEIVLLGNLDMKRLTARKKRKLRKETVRRFLKRNHGKFKYRLKDKAEEKGCRARLVNEFWTSKTCNKCGRIHRKLGSNRIHKCPYCGAKCPRDIGASRLIVLMNLASVLDEMTSSDMQ